MLKTPKIEATIICWASVCLLLQLVVGVFGLQYDAGGVEGAIWWLNTAASLPVILISEALGIVGFSATGAVAYFILTVALAAILYGLVRLKRRRSDHL